MNKTMVYRWGCALLLLSFWVWGGALADEAQDADKEKFMASVLHGHLFLYSFYCGVVSILVKIVDYIIKNQVDDNNARLPHEEIVAQALPLVGWFFSATVVGYLGVVSGFLNVSPQTAVAVGFAWPMVYEKLRKDMEKQFQPEDSLVEEKTGQ